MVRVWGSGLTVPLGASASLSVKWGSECLGQVSRIKEKTCGKMLRLTYMGSNASHNIWKAHFTASMLMVSL